MNNEDGLWLKNADDEYSEMCFLEDFSCQEKSNVEHTTVAFLPRSLLFQIYKCPRNTKKPSTLNIVLLQKY